MATQKNPGQIVSIIGKAASFAAYTLTLFLTNDAGAATALHNYR